MKSLAIDFTNMSYRASGVNAFVQFIDDTGDNPYSHLPSNWDFDNKPFGKYAVYSTDNLVDESGNNLVDENGNNLVGTTLTGYTDIPNTPFNAGPKYEVVNLLDEDGNNLVEGGNNLVANIRVDAEHGNRTQ